MLICVICGLKYYFLGDGFFVGGLVVDDVDAGVAGGGTTTIGGEDGSGGPI